MISFVSAEPESKHLPVLREMFIAEWGEMDPFAGPVAHVDAGVVVPLPVLALDGERLIGGLAFTSATIPGTQQIAVWINALWVLPEFRKQGIASQLIQKAQLVASDCDIPMLYVFTDVPALYQNQGWEKSETSGKNTVLQMPLK